MKWERLKALTLTAEDDGGVKDKGNLGLVDY